MAGCTISVTCPKCKTPFFTRIRWGEEVVEKCPNCDKGFVVDQGKLTQELRKLQIDSELSVIE